MIRHVSRTARFAGLLLCAAVALTGCAKGCSKKAAKSEAMQLIPADSNALVGIQWKKLHQSPIFEKFEKEMPAEIKVLLSDQIDEILIGLNVKRIGFGAPGNVVGIFSGKFDTDAVLSQLTSSAKQKGNELQSEEYEGVKLYTTLANTPDATSFCFIDKQLLMGNQESLKRSIDLSKKKGDSVLKNQALVDMLKPIDKKKMLWAVAQIPEEATARAVGGPPFLANVKAVDLAMDYESHFLVDMGVLANSKENAQQIANMANSSKTLYGGMAAQKDPNLAKIIEGLTIESKEDRVAISLKLDKSVVEELIKKGEQNNRMPSPPPPSLPPAPQPTSPAVSPETAPSGGAPHASPEANDIE